MVKSNPSSSHIGGTSTFIGFGAFAAPTTSTNVLPSSTASSPATNDSTAQTTSSNTNSTNSNNYLWTPVYMGHDDTFRALFVRIYQKREPITIVKALEEVQSHTIDLHNKNVQNKKVLVEAMKHYAYLYYHKLSIGSFTTSASASSRNGSGNDTAVATEGNHTKNDVSATATTLISTMMISTSSIRANSLKIWLLFYSYIPKAVMHVCYNHIEILGIIYAAQTDPASEVRNVVQQLLPDEREEPPLVHPLMLITSSSANNAIDAKWKKCWDDGIIAYTTTRILSYSKPILLLEALCGQISPSTADKSQQHKQQRSNTTITLNEQQRDVIDELYIRLVGNCLDSIGQWLQLLHQSQQPSIQITWEIVNIWFKPFMSYGAASTTSLSKSNQQQPHAVRRKSYQLLTIITTRAPYIYDLLDMDLTPNNSTEGEQGSKGILQKILLLAFSVDKDPVNIPHLLETTLSLLAYYNNKSEENCNTKRNETNHLLVLLLKPLIKLFNKACHGAKVGIWGPMMLPLVGGQYCELHEQYKLLSSLQAGVPFAHGINEKYHIWIAICETTSFILLRSSNTMLNNPGPILPQDLSTNTVSTESSNDETKDAAKNIAILWIDGFQFCLSAVSNLPNHRLRSNYDTNNRNEFLAPSTGFKDNATEGQKQLLQNIANQLIQYHQATTDQKDCLFMNVPNLTEWFWAGIHSCISKISHLRSLVQLIQELEVRRVMGISTKAFPVLAKLMPILKTKFHAALQEQQTSSSCVPSCETYEYFQSVLNYCGQLAIFDNSVTSSSVDNYKQPSLEQFIMNDLLRWSIIHTSSLETEQRHQRSTLLVQQDFALLSTCLSGLQLETKNVVWNLFLKEIIRADCDIAFLTDGLSTLMRNQGNSMLDLMPCEHLDHFVKDIDKLAEIERNALDSGENCANIDHIGKNVSARSKTQNLFRLCTGIFDDFENVIVSADVIANWVDYLSRCVSLRKPSQLGIELMLTLLEAILRKKGICGGDQITCLLISSWYLTDHPSIHSLIMDVLNADALERSTFQIRALQRLRSDFRSFVSGAASHEAEQNWAERVWFLYELEEGEISSFPLVGFECIDNWECNPSVVFRLAISLLHRVTSIPDRQKLVKAWARTDHVEFMVELLTTISEADTDFSLTTKCTNRNDRSALFLDAIGGKGWDTVFVIELARISIEKIGNILKQNVNDNSIQPRITVLRLVLETKFPSVQNNDLEKLLPQEIKEKDNLWYVTDPKNSLCREEVQVIKVHFDPTSGYFFSILLKRAGEYIERQTVIERLRKQQHIETCGKMMDLTIQSSNVEERKKLCSLIWFKLLANYLPVVSKYNLGGLVYILVTQIGLGDERGIGSFYYEVLQLIKGIEKSIVGAIANGDNDNLKKLLWTMSVSRGYGLHSSDCYCPQTQMWSPSPCINAVLDYYDENNVGHDDELDAAAAAFLTIFACLGNNSYISNIIKKDRFIILLFHLAASLLTHAHSTIEMASMIAYQAISQGISLINITAAIGSSVIDALQVALHISIQSFSDSGILLQPDSVQCSYLKSIVCACSKGTELREILSKACTSNSYALCGCLFIPSKRSLAFTLVELVHAPEKECTNADVVLSLESALKLNEWTGELNDHDAATLEEDVCIVAEWLPSRLMVEMEGWEEAGFELENEHIIIGRILTWFCVLRFVESAAPHNFRNRPAFINYLSRCGAAYSILNLGLLHNEIINLKEIDTVPVVDEVSEVLLSSLQPNITQLATLSLFRTVEVLPSLCRKWWENDCPRVYATAVQALVEKFVAPEIFKREIDRIKASTSFGKMTVTANVTSREITATYVQDDFILKVLIVLPSAFPFRSAEVDCSKTLGVPQSRWKRWNLQITMMLNSQGGTLQDALMLWKDNVDKEFEGVDPCPVCYSVLHVKTHKLPSLKCKTCNNRFHVECLTEWFRSSGKSQCVLCQQPWQGTRV